MFGENVEEFQFDRFLGNPTFKAADGEPIEPVRAFGGGAHPCPGRRFIGYESRALLATLLATYDLELSTTAFPGIYAPTNGMGISDPDRKIGIRLSRRSK